MTVFALVGTTLLVARSTIFESIRKLWPALLGCCQCAGTWIGAAAGGSGVVPVGHGRILDAVIVGTATSFLAMLADGVLLKLLGDPDEGGSHTEPPPR